MLLGSLRALSVVGHSGKIQIVLYPEDYLETLPDQSPPSHAQYVRDLIPLVGDNQRVTFRGSASAPQMEQTFFKVSVMGEYLNHGLPKIVPQPNVEEWPTPKRKNWEYRSLATLQDHHIKHDGRAEWMADFYRLGTSVFLVSDKVLQLILERDPEAVEMCAASIKGVHASEIGPYWVVMPLRVFDAVDISKSTVLLRRPEVLRGTGKFVTHVSYEKGYVIRDDLPSEVCCFSEEFKAGWYWRRDLIQAAATAGARGLHFGFGQVDLGREVKLRGHNDPSEY